MFIEIEGQYCFSVKKTKARHTLRILKKGNKPSLFVCGGFTKASEANKIGEAIVKAIEIEKFSMAIDGDTTEEYWIDTKPPYLTKYGPIPF